jgi:hypothetical protein
MQAPDTAASCTCGFTELADEDLTDHLLHVFDPGDQIGNDGILHEERQPLTCACGLSAITPQELDAHFLTVFAPGDGIGSDGWRHEPAIAGNGPTGHRKDET